MENPFNKKIEVAFEEKEFFPTEVVQHSHKGNIFDFESENHVLLRIEVVSDDIIRFRYAPDGYFQPDFSYALSGYEGFVTNQLDFSEKKKEFTIHTATVDVRISKRDLRIIVQDKAGKEICHDEKGFHWEKHEEFGGNVVQMSKVAHSDEAYYGLGDKPCSFNMRGMDFYNWGTDTYGYDENSNPLYKNIPFYYSLNDNMAYGIFLDNSFKSHFDFTKERRTVTSFWAQGGEMNYYFINGPQLLDVCKRYTLMTGTPEMPPLWSLGYQQCKWSYYPESQVRDICSKMREYKIPCDAIYLDIDYMDGFRCFTWDKEKFPDPKKMVSELAEDGFKTVVIIDPGIKIDKDYRVFKEGMENDYFCKRQDGPYVRGKVWPDECYFPDFTRPDVREWWAGLYKELIEEIGVQGVWNDMNEPAIFEVESKTFPLDVRHDYDGHPCSHRKGHNVYGMQMARATYEGVKRFMHPNRPLIITRSGYSGLQRYSSVWTGDNIASWRHLWIANAQCQRLAVSGISFAGSDVGGFIEQPTPELFYRWVQLAVFHPFFRTHSSGDHGDQEPWSFGEEALDLARKAIELRYRLLPNIYTAFYQYHTEGIPMLRPLSFVAQDDDETVDRMDEFQMGDNLLICPILEAGSIGRKLYLPEGNWYNYHTNQLEKGRRELYSKVNKEYIPVFVRAGSVMPHFPLMQYVGEKIVDEVTLRLYYIAEGKHQSQFYHDAGNGQGYTDNDYRLATFSMESTWNGITIEQNIKGNYQAEFATYQLELVGFPEGLLKIVLDGQEKDLDDAVRVPSNFKTLEIY